MPDHIELYVDKMRIEHFVGYQIDADLYTPAAAFSLELANPEAPVRPGHLSELYINGQKELTGIIDTVRHTVRKRGVALRVGGRDLMGLVIDSCVEAGNWTGVENLRLKTLAERLLKKTPFINRKAIIYEENVVGRLKGGSTTGGFLSDTDMEQPQGQIEPGMTIFDVLKEYSLSRGLLFYCRPDGTLVFARPPARGAPEYTLTMRRSGQGNNVLESERLEDYSRRYSSVTVVGQQQGGEHLFGAEAINTGGEQASHHDPSFPFHKPYVTIDNNDAASPAKRARMIMEKQRHDGTQLQYTAARHSQDGKNWRINAFCRVEDELRGISGDYLIYGRTFELSNEDEGPITRLRLGVPGLVA